MRGVLLFVVCALTGCDSVPIPMPEDLAQTQPDLVSFVDMTQIPDLYMPPADMAGKPAGARCTITNMCPTYECAQPTNTPKGAQAVEACCDPRNGEPVPDSGIGVSIGVCCWSMFIAYNGFDLQCKDCGDGWVCVPV